MTIVRLTLREAVSRRLLLAVLILTAVFVAVFSIGFAFARQEFTEGGGDPVETVFASTVLTVLGLYVASFLAAFLALFLSAGSVSSEIESGQLHAVLARPIPRASWLLQRWLGLAVVAVGYTLLLGTALLLVARAVAGYQAVRPLVGLGLMALQALTLLTLGVLGSTRLSTLANGAVVFFAFGLAWMAGLVEFVGQAIGNPAMERIGVVTSLIIPSDALWRGASAALSSPAFLAVTGAGSDELGLPFAGGALPSPAFLTWSLAYVAVLLVLAVRRFTRQDL
jgi:ABC-type transport system involved in multi-copper enzyme maturation permease subunit